MAKKFLAAIMMVAVCFGFVGCNSSDEGFGNDPVSYLKKWWSSLTHGVTINGDRASDDMGAKGVYTVGEDSTVTYYSPRMDVAMQLSKENYRITADQLEIQAGSPNVVREDISEGMVVAEKDTLFFVYPDGQRVTLPIKISSGMVEFGGKKYPYGSLRYESASCKLQNSKAGATRAAANEAGLDSVTYNTLYTSTINFREVNANDSLITVNLQKQTKRYIISTAGVDTMYVANDKYYPVSDSTAVWEFDKVVKMTTGDSTLLHKEFVLPYSVKGIDPWEKFVESLSYNFGKANGWTGNGEEQIDLGYANLLVWKRSGSYSAIIKNGVDADIVTDYSTTDCRAIYDDGDVRAELKNHDFHINEKKTFVEMLTSNKSGYDMAALRNLIDAEYVGHTQNIGETVYLYKKNHLVTGYDIVATNIKVEDDVETCDLIFRTHYSDGKIDSLRERRSFPREAVNVSNWVAYEQYAIPCITDSTLNINTTAITESKDGYWSWKRVTRQITNVVSLPGSTQTNIWKVTEPIEITYTREGVSHTFVVNFAVKEFGAECNYAGEANGVVTYDYSDNIRISVNENAKSVMAPGKIIINGKEVVGYSGKAESLIITQNDATATVSHTTKYVDGTENVEKVTKVIPISVINGTPWTATENNNSQTTGDVTFSLTGTEAKVDGEWSWVDETRFLSNDVVLSTSTQKNTWTAKTPNHIVFKRGDVTVDFGEINFSAVKVSDNITLVKQERNVDTYDYKCTMDINLSNPKATVISTPGGTDTGTLIVNNAVTVIDHDARNMRMSILDNEVICYLDYITIFSDGTETSEKAQMSFPKSVVCESDFVKYVQSATQNTGAASFNLSSTSAEETGFWKYDREVYAIQTTANLDFGTIQVENKWKASVPNNITYNRDGKSWSFGKIQFSATETGSTLTETESNDERTVYAYTDNINVTYGDNTVKSQAPGKVIVEVTVTNREAQNKKLTVTDTDVTASYDHVRTYSNGKTTSEKISKTIPLSVICTTNWSATENVYMEQTSDPTVSLNGTENKVDGEWSWVNQTRTINTVATLASSRQTNSWTSVVPNNIVCNHDGLTVDFGELQFAVTNQNSSLSMISSSNNVSVYNYTDNITVVYGGHNIASTAPGKLTIEVAVSGHEIRNKHIEVRDNDVYTKLTWITKFTDGSEKEELIEKFFNLNIVKYTEWTSTEENENQSTSSASYNMTGSNNKTDGDWSYAEEVYDIQTTATLSKSQQKNGWKATMPNKIVFSRDGQTATFDVLSFIANETGASTSKKSDNQFTYTDNIQVTYGGHNFNRSANGTINIEEKWTPDFPENWGKFKNMTTTCAPSTDNGTYVYTHSLKFENGTLLIVEDNSASVVPSYDPNLFTNDTNSALNGGAYRQGTWHHTIASDEGDYMLWKTSNGSSIRSLNYISATAMNWYTHNGKITVHAHNFTYSVNNGVLTIFKDGNAHGTFKVLK